MPSPHRPHSPRQESRPSDGLLPSPRFSAHAWRDGDSYAFLTRDQLDVHLRTAPDLIEGQNPSGVYFYLADRTAAALESEFRTAGVKILSPLTPREWKMNEFMLSDPDGNLLRFGEDI